MVDYKEIPQDVLSRSSLPSVLAKFRNKARSYKLVKDVSVQFTTTKAARTSAETFALQAAGTVVVEILGMPGLRLNFLSTGEYRRKDRHIYLTSLEVLNDVTGFANKLVEVTGVVVGRSMRIEDEDDALLVSLYPEKADELQA